MKFRRNVARFDGDLVKFGEISLDPVRLLPDLAEISPNLA